MIIYQPREELRPYVRYYWVLKGDEPFSILTFPIGCPQIIFHKKTPLYIPELDKSQSQFTISGQVNFPAHIQSDGSLEMIVAVFYPHTVGMFIDTPPSAFYNLEISGYDIENRQVNDVAQKIFNCENAKDCIDILEDFSDIEDPSGIEYQPSGFDNRHIALRSFNICECSCRQCLSQQAAI